MSSDKIISDPINDRSSDNQPADMLTAMQTPESKSDYLLSLVDTYRDQANKKQSMLDGAKQISTQMKETLADVENEMRSRGLFEFTAHGFAFTSAMNAKRERKPKRQRKE